MEARHARLYLHNMIYKPKNWKGQYDPQGRRVNDELVSSKLTPHRHQEGMMYLSTSGDNKFNLWHVKLLISGQLDSSQDLWRVAGTIPYL